MRKLFIDVHDMNGFAIVFATMYIKIYDYSGNTLITYYN